jgi:ribosome-binding ATPase YchF (GTP1/OBG family)
MEIWGLKKPEPIVLPEECMTGGVDFILYGREDEVRAWTIDKDLEAKTSRRKNHSDLEEVLFVRGGRVITMYSSGNSMNRCKEKRVVASEG